MSLRVFHPPGDWSVGQTLALDAEESHYLLRVRRARPGAALELLDGASACWQAHLEAVEGHAAVVRLVHPHPPVAVMALELLLVMPEPRATLESLTHASELGATAVWLVRGDRSPGGAPSSDRLTRTLRAAQRQCGRPTPPRLHGPMALPDALTGSEGRPGYLASVADRRRATPVVVDPEAGARLLVGPEGGLSDQEQQQAARAGLRALALGPWVLRAPTAVSAGLARLVGASMGDSEEAPRP
ncbi:MAG: RsmE family RNA methyltransferase [Myxococcales bacterium]|nr:RsmE family RNA methyltransferase [Myxococcales bacterium]